MTLDGLLCNLAVIGICLSLAVILRFIHKGCCDEIDWPEEPYKDD